MIPNLIHPIDIQLQQLGKSESFQDHDYREPIQQGKYGSTLTVKGQVQWTAKDELDVGIGGISRESRGYVLFRYVDLNKAGITLAENDRFVQLGFVEVDVYIVRLMPAGHYQSAGGPTLLKAYFADKAQTRQRRDF